MSNTEVYWDGQNWWVPQVNPEKTTSYEFKLTALSEQLDYRTIIEDLTRKNPMMFVEVSTEQDWYGIVLVHPSLVRKDILLNGDGDYESGVEDDDIGATIECQNIRDFAKWQKHYSEVKNAPWPEHVKEKATVKVSYVTL